VCGFALASALATLTAVDPYRSLLELRNVLEVSLFYLVVNHVTTEARASRLIDVLIAMGMLIALFGLSQSITYGAGFRIPGTSNYMTFANQLMLVDILVLAQLLFNGKNRRVLCYAPAFLLLTTALLMTQTRNAWLGLMGGLFVVLGLRKQPLILVLPLLAGAALLFAPAAVKERLRSTIDLRDATAQERLYMWTSGLKIIRDHPWTGVGPGGVLQVYPAYRDPHDPRGAARLSHLHNNPLQVTAERGLIGLACWLSIWIAYGRRVWRIHRSVGSYHGTGRALVIGSLASVVGFHIAGLFEHNFGDAEVITLLYFLMALPFTVQAPDTPAPPQA
jgi:O-antigen ligase